MAKIEYLNETEVKELIKQTIKDIESGVRNKELQQAIGGGLYLIVELNRESYYRVRPTVKKKRTWVTIGAVRLKNKANIPGLTLSDARDKVLEYKKAFTDGNNLMQVRKQSIECSTVNDLCNEYKKVVPIIRNSKASELSILYSIKTIQNILGETKLIDLTEDDIEYNILRPKAEHIPAMRKDFKTLRQMLNYAIDIKYINNNPANIIASPLLKFKHKPKRQVLNESDLEKLFNKLYELDNIPFKFAIAIHLLFLLMIRRVELVSVKWDQIDLTQATLNLDKNKTDAPTVIPLSTQSIALFKTIQKNTEIFGEPQGYVFKGERRGGFVAENSINIYMTKLKDVINKDISPHVTRRTASSILHKIGFDMAVVESALNHSKSSLNSIWAVYNLHDYYNERCRMLQIWGDKINSYLSVEARKKYLICTFLTTLALPWCPKL